MKGYEPFPIVDLRSGYRTDAEPWLLVSNAFQEATNVYFYNGRLCKRAGYEAIATGTPLWDVAFNNGQNEPTAGDYIESTTETDGAVFVSVTVNGGTWAGLNASGTVRVAKATAPLYGIGEVLANVTATGTVGDILAVPVQIGFDVLASGHVMGIWEHKTVAGSKDLLVFDKSYLYTWDSTNLVFIGRGGCSTQTPDFSGSDSDFFWLASVGKGQLGATSADLSIIVNDVDTPKVWDGSDLTDLSATNMPDAARFVVHHKNRLVFLNTTEGAQRYPQRARCTDVGTYNLCAQDYAVDAETTEWITGVAFVRNELLVFFENSAWWLRYTGDSSAPFGWTRISGDGGAFAPLSVLSLEEEAVAMGANSWNSCDGLSVRMIDTQVPNMVIDMNADKLQYGYAATVEKLRQYVCTFPSIGKNYPDKMVVWNYVEKTWSIYKLAAHSLGYWSETSDWTFDDITVTMDEVDFAFDDTDRTAGFQTVLMGDVSGNIYKCFVGTSDNGSAIEATARTKRLCPYPNSKAKLGYIDLVGDSGSALSVTLKVYKDYNPTAFFTRTVSLYEAGKNKIRSRIRVMEWGENFEVELYDNSTGNPWAIDAIILYFKQGGNLA